MDHYDPDPYFHQDLEADAYIRKLDENRERERQQAVYRRQREEVLKEKTSRDFFYLATFLFFFVMFWVGKGCQHLTESGAKALLD